MTTGTADALAIVGIIAVIGVVSIVAREHFRPVAPRYGRDAGFGNDDPRQAAVLNDLSHNGTHTGTEA